MLDEALDTALIVENVLSKLLAALVLAAGIAAGVCWKLGCLPCCKFCEKAAPAPAAEAAK